ncbi:hypothetical protein PIB30_096660 [Stylosanthes scabra]|uniref:Aminotransferase-like plant mobile domain-containing protein n=1 Tax=Stylosanthes scabra TaxID=79078 RepID=A0ABU6XYJ4_9FABA|nr:hypothetical protein [Stylosanthes scabra]
MSRMKKTQKRSREGELSIEPPPKDHALAKWFYSNDDLIFYELRLAGRKEIPPRYLNPKLLDSQNFNHLKEMLNIQGLMDFVQFRDKYYPELTSIAYATLGMESNTRDLKDFSMVFKLGRNIYKVHCSRLASIWNLPLDGCLFEGGKTPLEDWGYDKMRAMQMFNLTQNEKSKIPCQPMNDEYRTLLYLVTYILEPRISGHGNVADEDLVLMWAMVNEIKINWSYLILHHMLRLKGKDTSGGLGYLCLWSRIFNYLGIDVSNENVKHFNPRWSEINEVTLHHMGRGKEEEEQAPQMAFRGHPGPSSQEQPSMSDLMQVLQSIEQNIDQRFQRIEDNQTSMDGRLQRMDRRLQRMERHMNIQEEEDEDQE